MAAAWTAGGITVFFLLILGMAESRSTGRTLFYLLFALGCYGVVKRGFGLTADLFSEERRNGTLGLSGRGFQGNVDRCVDRSPRLRGDPGRVALDLGTGLDRAIGDDYAREFPKG